jgi:hypothetical protein
MAGYARCLANGCMADYAAGAELVDQLKQGKKRSWIARSAKKRIEKPAAKQGSPVNSGARSETGIRHHGKASGFRVRPRKGACAPE